MATAPSEINMGYGGFCGVDWKTDSLIQKPFTDVATTPPSITPHQIFITGGNIGVSYNRPTENTYKAPRDTTAASPLLFGNGTAQISGQISFDMAHFNIGYFLDQAKLSRNTYFHLLMSDGGNTYGVYYNNENFTINNHLLTKDGKYNYQAFILSDQNDLSYKIAQWEGPTKRSKYVFKKEFGNGSVLKAIDDLNSYIYLAVL